MTDWARIWRSNGVFFVVLFVVGWIVFGSQPKPGASADKLVSFYDGDRTRILIAVTLLAFNLLNLLWFSAALSTDLRDAGEGGWATAQTAAATATGAVLFGAFALQAGLAYSVAASGNTQL